MMRYKVLPTVLTALSYLFILSPIVIVALIAFSSGDFFSFPPSGFSTRWFEAFFANAELKNALLLSVELAALSATIATILATLGALGIAGRKGIAASFLQALFLAPLVFPTVVLGVALLIFFQSLGGIGGFTGLLIAHVIVGAPFAVRSIVASLLSLDPRLDEAGQSLRAGPIARFRLITLPLIWPGVLAGWMFAFVVSFGELNTAIFLSTPGATTLPIAVYNYLQFEGGQLVIAAASTIQMALILVLVAVVQQFVGLRRIVKS